MAKSRYTQTNRNSRIASKRNGSNTVKTQTTGRDAGTLNVEVTSKKGGKGSTRLYIESANGEFLGLNGFEARTLYNTLAEHFAQTGRSY